MALGGATQEQILEHLKRTLAEQGLPMQVTDPGVLARIARSFDLREEAA